MSRRRLAGAAVGLLLVLVTGCHQQATATLTVTPTPSAVDQPVSITFRGPATAHVTITARATDAAGRAWQSHASFIADAAGTVDTARDTATGSYHGIFADGLIAMMTPVKSVTGYVSFDSRSTQPTPIDFTARVDGRDVAQTTLTRSALPAVSATTTIDDQGFDATLYRASGSGPHPAVMILGGSEGGNSGLYEASLLADRGTVALSVAYFNPPHQPNQYPGLPNALTEIPLEYFAKALRWLRQQPGVETQHVWLSGGSRGSEAALLTAAIYPQLVNGVIAAAPTNTVHAGLTGQEQVAPTSAWSLNGEPVPYTAENGAEPGDVPAAVIKVERIQGPVIAICGEQDQLWASCPFSEAIIKRLADHGRPYARQLLSYPVAGHGVGGLLIDLPYITDPTGLPTYGSTPDANAEATADAWPKVLGFVLDHSR